MISLQFKSIINNRQNNVASCTFVRTSPQKSSCQIWEFGLIISQLDYLFSHGKQN